MEKRLRDVRKEYPRIRVRIKGNTTSFEVDCRNKRWLGQKFFSFQSKTDAIKKAQEVATLVNEYGKTGINPEDIRLLDRIRTKLVPYNVTIEDAVDSYLTHLADKAIRLKTLPIENVTASYIEAKNHGNRVLAKKTLIGFNTTCNALHKCFPARPIGDISRQEIEKTINENWENNASRKDYLISSIF